MTLLQLISALGTQNVNVTVTDAETDAEIIVFKSTGIDAVEDTLSARPVRKWKLTGATAIEVILGVE